MSWFDGSGAGSAVDVSAVMDSQVPELLWAVVEAGALVSVGRTSDGGALAITVTMDGKWRREYFRGSDDAIAWLMEAVEAVERESERLSASSGPRSRPRGRQRPS